MKDNTINEFIRNLYLRDYSANTLDTYDRDLRQFQDFIGDKSLLKATRKDIQAWFAKLKADGYEGTSINRKIHGSLASLYTWAKKEGLIKLNPCEEIEFCKVKQKQIEILTDDEIKKMVENPVPNTLESKLVISLLANTGARLSEVAGILRDNLKDNYIKILGKGNKERVIFITDETKRLLGEYLKHKNGDKRLFSLSPAKIQGIVKKTAEYNKISKKVYPHLFRHTFATKLLRGGTNIESVRQILGWSTLKMVTRYIHLNTDDLYRDYQKAMV